MYEQLYYTSDNFVVADCSFLLQEWGDPRKEEFYFYMKSYSPVDNVRTIRLCVSLIHS
jgi:protease II